MKKLKISMIIEYDPDQWAARYGAHPVRSEMAKIAGEAVWNKLQLTGDVKAQVTTKCGDMEEGYLI